MAQYSQNLVFQGLGTISVTAPFAMTSLVVESKSSIPTLTNGGGVSALVSVVKQNASTILTSATGASGIRAVIPNVAAGDVISIVYTSANAVDAALNAIKSQIVIWQGE
jgi:hypothetical protein